MQTLFFVSMKGLCTYENSLFNQKKRFEERKGKARENMLKYRHRIKSTEARYKDKISKYRTKLKVDKEKLKHSLIVSEIGNTYSGASMLALCNVLDNCKGGERILMTSFGSGAGSDSFSIKVTDLINEKKGTIKSVKNYISDKEFIDYSTYLKFSGGIR